MKSPGSQVIWALVAVAVLLAMVAAVVHPSAYAVYQLTRWAVCAASVVCGIACLERSMGFALSLFVLAIIFNPIAPVRFSRDAWAVLDVIAAIWLVAAGVFATRLTEGKSRGG